jgi:hypothetical protein
MGVVALAAAMLAAGGAGELGAQVKLPKSGRPAVPLVPGGRHRDRAPDDVPPAYRPPPGMCRIWLDNVAPEQQPAATDCNSAVRNRPPNARVLFGDDYAAGAGGRGAAYAVTKDAPASGETMAARWTSRVWLQGPRPHGPSAGDAPLDGMVDAPVSVAASGRPRSTRPRGPRPAPRPPVTRTPVRRPAPAVREADDLAPAAADDWEAGYAAGYRDAMRGRRPRVRGAERADPADDVSPDARGGSVVGGGTVLAPRGGADPLYVVPSGGNVDPRYFNNGQNPPPGRANGVCLDRDGDGWCDDPRFGAPVCRDLDGDGRCDDYPALAAAPFPNTLPDMRAGADVRGGQGSATALRWLGTSEVLARTTGSGRGGAPARVVWLDANTGTLLQVWTDRDGDGTADRVEVYRNGRRVKLIGR